MNQKIAVMENQRMVLKRRTDTRRRPVVLHSYLTDVRHNQNTLCMCYSGLDG